MKDTSKNSGEFNNSLKEYNECVAHIINTCPVQKMKEFRHHSVINCYEHSVNVSITSYKICRILGLNYKSAAIGGLLHDLFLYDWHTTKLEDGLHGFLHPKIALSNACELVELNNIERDIILKHMFPLTIMPPFYRESFVVCLVDKYCAITESLRRPYNNKIYSSFIYYFRKILLLK
jgi:uncharacterized protein